MAEQRTSEDRDRAPEAPPSSRPVPGPPLAEAAPERQRDPQRTRLDILDVATREFAERGYSGGRVDEIAARTRTTKRMIYH